MCSCTTDCAVVHRRKGESHGDLTSRPFGMGRKEHRLVWPLSWSGVDPAWPPCCPLLTSTAADPSQPPLLHPIPAAPIPGLRPGKAALAQACWVLVKLLLGAFYGFKPPLKGPWSGCVWAAIDLSLSLSLFFPPSLSSFL